MVSARVRVGSVVFFNGFHEIPWFLHPFPCVFPHRKSLGGRRGGRPVDDGAQELHHAGGDALRPAHADLRAFGLRFRGGHERGGGAESSALGA